MKIAIPVTDTREFSAHYGAASSLVCFEVNPSTRALCVESLLTPAGGSPCTWPDRLHHEGVTVMLVGGMGGGPRARYASLGIEVITGITAAPPVELAARFLAGTLQPGESACRHGDHEHPHDHAHDHAHGGHCNCAH